MRLRATIAAGLALLASGGAAAQGRFAATITRTSYGIPHIVARDWQGAGYGVAYAYAGDNLCLLAEEFVTVAGERSRWFGPEGKVVLGFDPIANLHSDIFVRSAIDLPALRRGFARMPADARAMTTGYVAGYNRALRDLGPERVPVACRGKGWVRPITLDDMLRLSEKQVLLASSLALAPFVALAAPPKQAAAVPAFDPFAPRDIGFGSNGWAFGGEVTANGRGVLVGNPHFPWSGPNRFYEMHITIPGTFDVMGAALAGMPTVAIGFNKDVAWTHTVTAARHFTLYELALDPADPTAYLVDGKREAMTRQQISVPMPDGRPAETRTLYRTRYGPVVMNPLIGLVWNGRQAFAMRDANAGNQRAIGAWLAIGRARNVAEIRRAAETTLGIPWVNTIAADRHGDALHADVTPVPNVSRAKAAACATPLSPKVAGRITLLDGSKAACAWDVAAGTAVPGLMPPADQQVYLRRDYLANSNDSYWLSNPKAPAPQRSPLLGEWATERTLRTRSGLVEIAAMLAAGKVDNVRAGDTMLASASLAGTLAVDRLLPLCRAEAELAAACAALAGWDRHYNLDSRGAYLFAAFWEAARTQPGLWTVPFDAADPVNTPRDLATGGAAGTRLVTALKAAVARLGKEGIALDARWGDVQFAQRGDARIPIHGAHGDLGVLNMQRSVVVPGGVTPVHGTSYIQAVGFDEAGPVARALLSYSQSTDPASPHFGDQTRAFSQKAWHRMPFTAAEIAADAKGPPLRISE